MLAISATVALFYTYSFYVVSSFCLLLTLGGDITGPGWGFSLEAVKQEKTALTPSHMCTRTHKGIPVLKST